MRRIVRVLAAIMLWNAGAPLGAQQLQPAIPRPVRVAPGLEFVRESRRPQFVVPETQWKKGMVIGAIVGFTGTFLIAARASNSAYDVGLGAVYGIGVAVFTGLIGALIGGQFRK